MAGIFIRYANTFEYNVELGEHRMAGIFIRYANTFNIMLN